MTDMQDSNARHPISHPRFDVEHGEQYHRDSLDRTREQELLDTIARLQQQVTELTASHEELRSCLHDREEKYGNVSLYLVHGAN